MPKETVCKYIKVCNFFINKKIDSGINTVIRNTYCRSNFRNWEECKRYLIYKKGLKPMDNVTPKDNRSLEAIEKEILEKIRE